MIAVNHHCAASIIESQDSEELLLGLYDLGYPNAAQRGKVNLIGGNCTTFDTCPWETFNREIREEFSSVAEQEPIDRSIEVLVGKQIAAPSINHQFAAAEQIHRVKEITLTSTIPYQDFIISLPASKSPINVLHSVFFTSLPQLIFEEIRMCLYGGLSLRSEGSLRITTRAELVQNMISTAYGAGPILEHYTGDRLPYSSLITSSAIGMPRRSFSEYLAEYSYVHAPGAFT
jgi:hypothetical protein